MISQNFFKKLGRYFNSWHYWWTEFRNLCPRSIFSLCQLYWSSCGIYFRTPGFNFSLYCQQILSPASWENWKTTFIGNKDGPQSTQYLSFFNIWKFKQVVQKHKWFLRVKAFLKLQSKWTYSPTDKWFICYFRGISKYTIIWDFIHVRRYSWISCHNHYRTIGFLSDKKMQTDCRKGKNSNDWNFCILNKVWLSYFVFWTSNT